MATVISPNILIPECLVTFKKHAIISCEECFTLSSDLPFIPVNIKLCKCSANHFYYLQRLGGLMSVTVRVGLSMSLPLRLTRLSSHSGVKTLLPLLVLKEWSVGLKLTGDRKLVPWVLLALGKVLRPTK